MAVIRTGMIRPYNAEIEEAFKDVVIMDKIKIKKQKRAHNSDAHKRLVDIGRKWLMTDTPTIGNCICGIPSIVVTEIVTSTNETPDIIAFAGHSTVLLEAKTSRQDFKNDAKKLFRQRNGMGNYRCYITPPGLIAIEELPEKWGLIEVSEKGKCKKIKYPEKFPDSEVNRNGEMGILMSVIKRIGRNTDAKDLISIKCYIHETKNTATLTINDED